MAKFIRYTLASVCFAASVACLAMWGWTKTYSTHNNFVSYFTPRGMWQVQLLNGIAHGRFVAESVTFTDYSGWRYSASEARMLQVKLQAAKSSFGQSEYGYFCPLWYPALAFALAGVGVIRFRRQFSIRSTLIAFAVVAALLAMPLTL